MIPRHPKSLMKLSRPMQRGGKRRNPFSLSLCLKMTKKVAFNIASEASYVYILSGKKLIKTTNGPFLRLFKNLKLLSGCHLLFRNNFLFTKNCFWFNKKSLQKSVNEKVLNKKQSRKRKIVTKK